MDANASADTGADASGPDADWPTPVAKVVAFGVIALAGACGSLIGWAVADLQCAGSCTAQKGLGALLGGVIAAGGVAVIAVLALQALAEWQAQEGRRRPPHGG
jgi:hypothetical protein